VKFALPIFTLLGGYLGISDQKKPKNLPINFESCKLFRHRILVKFMCHMRVTCLRNVLKFGVIWFINDKFVGTKLRWIISPQIFEAPSSETTARTQKVKVGPKMVRTCFIHMPSLVAICRRTAAREETNGCFLFVFIGRATSGIKITQVSNFGIFRPAVATRLTD